MAKSTRKKTPATGSGRSQRGPAAEPTAAAVNSHRARQATVATILEQVFGAFADMKPHLWERRAYLLLVGSVYERLATNDEVTTDELVKLARVLAEHRRLKASAGEDTDTGDREDTPGNGRLPNGLADAVRDLYGTAAESDNEEALKNGGVGG